MAAPAKRLKCSGTILCVVVRPGAPAESHTVTYGWTADHRAGTERAKEIAEADALKAVAGIRLMAYGPYYPDNDDYVVLCDQEWIGKGLPPNRMGYVGTIIVLARGRTGYCGLKPGQARKLLAQLNAVA